MSSETAHAAIKHPILFLLHYVRRRPIGHLTILLSVMCAIVCSVGSQYAMKHLVDILSRGPDQAGIWAGFLMMVALVAGDNLSWRVGGWISSFTFVGVSGDMRRDLFRHLTGHSPTYFSDRMPGMLASRISATASAADVLEEAFFWGALPQAMAVIMAIFLMMTVNPVMAATVFGIATVMAGTMIAFAARGRALQRQQATTNASVDGEMVDVFNNIAIVRAFGATVRERERFSGLVESDMRARRKSIHYLERLRTMHAALTAALTAGLLAWGLHLWQNHLASTGDMVLITNLGFVILHSTRDLALSMVNMVQNMARVSEAAATLLLPHDLPEHHTPVTLTTNHGAIEFENVSFGYPNSSSILKGFNLSIQPGEKIGLVGRSGSGKSTVLTLLQRLRETKEGTIMIDGEDITHLSEASLRNSISIVPQDVMLFHRSVRENIRYGAPMATDAQVEAAAAAAGCTEFIESLPEGYDTTVGDRGNKLSGGQKQRIAIARAFLKNAPILVLDEATSALDTESELAVQRALDRLMQGRTVIAVAHRLSTLQDFDRILVLQHGQIIQEGAPRELEHTKGPYRDLLTRQPAAHLQLVA